MRLARGVFIADFGLVFDLSNTKAALTRPGFTGGFCVTAFMTSATNPYPNGG